jgi:hypothetical protein
MTAETLEIDYDSAMVRYESGDKFIVQIRQGSKISNYGMLGGMGPDAFVDYARGFGVEITLEHSMDLHQNFRRTWPETVQYFRYCSEETGEEGEARYQVFVRTGMVRGRVRYTAFANGNFQHLAAVGAGDATYQTVKEMYVDFDLDPGPYERGQRSPLYGSRAWLNCHDELGIEIPEKIIGRAAASRAAERLRQVMIDKMQERCPDVPIGASVAMCRSWLKGAKAVRDADGNLVPSKPHKDAEGRTTWVADVDEDELPPSPRLGRFARRTAPTAPQGATQ